MKKDRNCGANATPYPVYQMQQPMMPMMPNMYQGSFPIMQQPMMQNSMMNTVNPMNQINYSSTSIEQQISNINSQITNLERRVNSLENIVGASANGNNYNTSNFQMM